MQADITNLAQAYTSDLQFLEPPKGQMDLAENSNCIHWTGNFRNIVRTWAQYEGLKRSAGEENTMLGSHTTK